MPVTTKVKINLTGTIFQKKGTGAADIIQQELSAAMSIFLKQALSIARQETPIGATGKLKQSVTISEPKGRKVVLEGSIKWTAPYAKTVDQGGPPRTVQIGRLKQWALVKLGDERAAYPIRNAIKTRGTPSPNHPNPGKGMSERVNQKMNSRLQNIIGIAAKNVASRL